MKALLSEIYAVSLAYKTLVALKVQAEHLHNVVTGWPFCSFVPVSAAIGTAGCTCTTASICPKLLF